MLPLGQEKSGNQEKFLKMTKVRKKWGVLKKSQEKSLINSISLSIRTSELDITFATREKSSFKKFVLSQNNVKHSMRHNDSFAIFKYLKQTTW